MLLCYHAIIYIYIYVHYIYVLYIYFCLHFGEHFLGPASQVYHAFLEIRPSDLIWIFGRFSLTFRIYPPWNSSKLTSWGYRLVVYPLIYGFSITSQMVGTLGFLVAINSIPWKLMTKEDDRRRPFGAFGPFFLGPLSVHVFVSKISGISCQVYWLGNFIHKSTEDKWLGKSNFRG